MAKEEVNEYECSLDLIKQEADDTAGIMLSSSSFIATVSNSKIISIISIRFI